MFFHLECNGRVLTLPLLKGWGSVLRLSAHRQGAIDRNALVRHDAEEPARGHAGVVHQHFEIAPVGNRSPSSQELTVATASPKSLAIFFSGILFFTRQLWKAVAKLARMSHLNFGFLATGGACGEFIILPRKSSVGSGFGKSKGLFSTASRRAFIRAFCSFENSAVKAGAPVASFRRTKPRRISKMVGFCPSFWGQEGSPLNAPVFRVGLAGHRPAGKPEKEGRISFLVRLPRAHLNAEHRVKNEEWGFGGATPFRVEDVFGI